MSSFIVNSFVNKLNAKPLNESLKKLHLFTYELYFCAAQLHV